MPSLTTADSIGAAPPSSEGSLRQRAAAYLVARRVKITGFLFIGLIAEDILIGVNPHPLFDVSDRETVLGCFLVFVGLAIRSWSAGILQKTRELAIAGPYAIVRNPLYVGSFSIMGGFATIIGDMKILYFILGPLSGLYYLQVLHEERVLGKKFGSCWEQYAREVPRFIPRRMPHDPLAAWSSGSWLGNREYRTLGAVLLGLLLVELWRVS